MMKVDEIQDMIDKSFSTYQETYPIAIYSLDNASDEALQFVLQLQQQSPTDFKLVKLNSSIIFNGLHIFLLLMVYAPTRHLKTLNTTHKLVQLQHTQFPTTKEKFESQKFSKIFNDVQPSRVKTVFIPDSAPEVFHDFLKHCIFHPRIKAKNVLIFGANYFQNNQLSELSVVAMQNYQVKVQLHYFFKFDGTPDYTQISKNFERNHLPFYNVNNQQKFAFQEIQFGHLKTQIQAVDNVSHVIEYSTYENVRAEILKLLRQFSDSLMLATRWDAARGIQQFLGLNYMLQPAYPAVSVLTNSFELPKAHAKYRCVFHKLTEGFCSQEYMGQIVAKFERSADQIKENLRK